MLDRLGNFLVEITDSRRGRATFVIAVACLAGLLEYIAHWTIERYLSGGTLAIVMDSATIALAVAVISAIEVKAVQQRRRKVLDDIRVVSELNHHVRNALQIIQYASRMPEEKRQVEIIDDSVARIDSTLKELFPSLDFQDRK